MPNPLFMPVIGDSFGDVMRQQAGWAGFNSRMDEANISRANAAEQTRNSYLQTVAQMQQAENVRQAALQQRESEGPRADRWQYAQEAERQKERAQDIVTRKNERADDLKFAREQLAAQEKAQAGKQKFSEMQLEKAIDQRGQNHAAVYAELNFDQQLAQKTLDALDEKLAEHDKMLKELSAKKASKLTPEEKGSLGILPIEISKLTKQRVAADRALETVSRKLAGHEATMGAQGFNVRDDKIVHVDSGKEFNFKQAVKDARNASTSPAATEADTGASADAVDASADENAPPAWVSAGPGALSPGDFSVTPAPGQSPVSPMKIGRFSVTPR